MNERLAKALDDLKPQHGGGVRHGREQVLGTSSRRIVWYSVWFFEDRPGLEHLHGWRLVAHGESRREAELKRDEQCKLWRLPYRKSQWHLTEDTYALARCVIDPL